jgi:hypothetical protein
LFIFITTIGFCYYSLHWIKFTATQQEIDTFHDLSNQVLECLQVAQLYTRKLFGKCLDGAADVYTVKRSLVEEFPRIRNPKHPYDIEFSPEAYATLIVEYDRLHKILTKE